MEDKKTEFNSLKTRQDVANILGIKERSLRYFLYRIRPERMYHTFYIPKRNGDKRMISAPYEKLNNIQKKLAIVLSDAYKPKVCTYGFVEGKSHISNAEQHAQKRIILNIDLKDFFSQIHFGRVCGMLMAKPYCLGREAAITIAQLACYKGRLPQGAPSSPVITNMVCRSLDTQMINLAKKYSCTYTRYADDITLSTYAKSFPEEIVQILNGKVQIGSKLQKLLDEQSFEVNPNKITLRYNTNHQEVTGLTVNSFPNLQRSYIKNIRAALYQCQKNGIYAAAQSYVQLGLCKNENIKSMINDPENDAIVEAWYITVLKGKIGYIGQVKGKKSATFLALAEKLNKICEEEIFDVSALHGMELLAQNNVFVLQDESGIQGSGFYLKNVGLVTSYHVVSNREFFRVYKYTDYPSLRYGVVSLELGDCKSDASLDYAVFNIAYRGSTENQLEIGDSRSLHVGDSVTIIGYPNFMQGDSPYIQSCTVTSITKLFNEPFYTVSGRIVHGASGGVVLDANKKVVGIIKGGVESMSQSDDTDKQGFIPIHLVI